VRNGGVSELRHRGEQVVLDLEVEVTHPPTHEVEWARGHIHGVHCGISNPVYLQCIFRKTDCYNFVAVCSTPPQVRT